MVNMDIIITAPRPVQVDRVEAWISALQSGKYRQIRRALRDADDGFCAYGVAADVYAEMTGNGNWGLRMTHFTGQKGFRIIRPFLLHEEEANVSLQFSPPLEVLDWYGILGPDQPSPGRIITMNDEDGKTFDEISLYLKETYL